MANDYLVSTQWLAERMKDPGLRIVDLRGHLRWERRHAQIPWQSARKDYEKGHIPGAVHLDFTTDLVDLDDPVPLQVAPFDKLQQVLSELGVGDEHLVVAYDADRSIFATRLWWIFRLCGHSNIRVLDGGWPKWLQENRPVNAELPDYRPADFTVKAYPSCRMEIEAVVDSLDQPDVCLVDARAEGDFLGNPKWADRGGHIPGAVNVPAGNLLNADGTFRSVSELRAVVEAHGIPMHDSVVTYCGLGLSATAMAFVLDMLGCRDVSVFDGSWAEWGARQELPLGKPSG